MAGIGLHHVRLVAARALRGRLSTVSRSV